MASNAGPTEVYRFAVDPAGTRLVGVGNFTSVGGQTRYRAFMLTLGATSASVNAWDYLPLRKMCAAASIPDYMRDVDFSPDGSWFVLVSTGFVPRTGEIGETLCDADGALRDRHRQPVPADLDQLHRRRHAALRRGHRRRRVRAGSPALAGQRRTGATSPAPGAVSRPGIGAIDPVTGQALSWNPTKDRGVGGKDLLVTPRGLWVGSDTDHIGGEFHNKIALMPVP